MKYRIFGLSLLVTLFVGLFLGLNYLEVHSFTESNISEIPGKKGPTGQPFGQFTETVKIADWDRENTFINYHLYLEEGVGPDITTIDERNDNFNEKAKRVLVIGDSFVWGDGVTDPGMTVGIRIQDELNAMTKPGQFMVINKGKSGASTYNHAEYFTPEKIKELAPDIIIYAYYVNDTVPNFNEKMICGDKDVCDQFSPQTAPTYRSCIAGEDDYLGKFIKKIIRPNYPSLSSRMLVRKCDAIYQKLLKTKLSDEELWSNNSLNPWFSTWKQAVNTLAQNTKGIPTYMAELYFNLPKVENDREVLTVFKENGFKVIEMPGAISLIKENGNAVLALNPVNSHSNSWLTKSYAQDIAKVVVSDQGGLVNPQEVKEFNTGYKLISSSLPSNLIVKENTLNSAVLSVPKFKKSDAFPHLIAGETLPDQYVACMDIGYPHIQLNLNRFFKGDRIKVSSKDYLGELTLGYYYYDNNAKPTYIEVGTINNSTEIRIPEINNGILLTIGDKNIKNGCALNKVITLKPFTLTLKS